ncbi:hypothetical protein [Halalkalibacter flavus]
MFFTPEEAFKRKQRKKMIFNFVVVPMIALAIGLVVAVLGK